MYWAQLWAAFNHINVPTARHFSPNFLRFTSAPSARLLSPLLAPPTPYSPNHVLSEASPFPYFIRHFFASFFFLRFACFSFLFFQMIFFSYPWPSIAQPYPGSLSWPRWPFWMTLTGIEATTKTLIAFLLQDTAAPTKYAPTNRQSSTP